MRDLQLVIFDCDGVLVDSETISNAVLARALTAEGLPTTLPQSRRDYQGLLLAEIDSRAQAKLGHPLAKDWIERYERDRTIAFRRELRAVPGVAEAIQQIKEAGPAVCVASQGKLEKTRLSLQLTKLDPLFVDEALFSAYSVPRGKPHPDLFLHAAQAMAAEPSRCAVVEDTLSGVTAAVAAGMRVVGYAADSDAAVLRAAGAEVFEAMEELPGMLGFR
jgi:HAD superfamily hydrolase (TIGR01509 family)